MYRGSGSVGLGASHPRSSVSPIFVTTFSPATGDRVVNGSSCLVRNPVTWSHAEGGALPGAAPCAWQSAAATVIGVCPRASGEGLPLTRIPCALSAFTYRGSGSVGLGGCQP